MSLTLKVLSPDQNVYDDQADEIILPSTTGQIGILPGHISLLTAIDIGVLRIRVKSSWSSIALTGGFAEVDSDEVTVLVNNAELGKNINANSAEVEFSKAEAHLQEISTKGDSAEKLKAQQNLNIARARVQASKKFE